MNSSKKALPCFILCFLFGVFGFHRFYVGRYISGFFQLITAGGFGIWTFFDLIMILFERFKDREGQILKW